MDDRPSPTLWSTVAALPDYLLLSQTSQLARHEQALQVLVLDHLREIEVRRLHLTRGYGSLFDYAVRELGYTAAAAWRRIKAMQLCTDVGAAGDLLRDGSLNLSNAAQLQNLFERSDRNERKRAGRPGSDGGKGGSGKAARDARPPGEPASSAPAGAGERGTAAGPVLDAAAREKLVRQAAGKSTRDVQQMLAELDPELAQPNDRMRALGTGALGAEGGDRRGVPAWAGEAADVAVAHRPAPDAGRAGGAAGAGRPGPLRPGAATAYAAHRRPRPGERRAIRAQAGAARYGRGAAEHRWRARGPCGTPE